jgi:CRISPR-associated endoribonuclease Cas6
MSSVAIDATSAADGLTIPQLDGPEIVAKAPPAAGQAGLVFLTLADLKSQGQRIDHLDGPGLFRRLNRRVGTLAECFCDPPVHGPFDYRPLADLAGQVVVADQQVSSVRWDRYSGRQRTKHPLSGLIGQAVVTQIPDALWPYLILGQWVHIGKGASFGQDRYVVLPPPPYGD